MRLHRDRSTNPVIPEVANTPAIDIGTVAKSANAGHPAGAMYAERVQRFQEAARGNAAINAMVTSATGYTTEVEQSGSFVPHLARFFRTMVEQANVKTNDPTSAHLTRPGYHGSQQLPGVGHR